MRSGSSNGYRSRSVIRPADDPVSRVTRRAMGCSHHRGWCENIDFLGGGEARVLLEKGIQFLAFWSAGFRQSGFFSQLRINLRQVFPKPFVALPAQQGMLPVVRAASLLAANLLSSESLFLHPRFPSFLKNQLEYTIFHTATEYSSFLKTGEPHS